MAYFKGMIYFKDVPGIGDLYLEEVLFEYDHEPMVFICKDRFARRYLCVCDDNINEYSWIAVKVSETTIDEIKSNYITILTPFKETENEVLVVTGKFGEPNCSYEWCHYKDIDKSELPVKDQYLFTEDEEEIMNQYLLAEEEKEMNERDVFESELKSVLGYLTKLLRYTDECADLKEFTYSIDPSKFEIVVNITAYFEDGGTKKIVTGIDMYEIITDIISGITGPRHYEFNSSELVDILNNIKKEYSLKLKECIAINEAVKIITYSVPDDNTLCCPND